jgi:hypothetical protein
METPHETRRGWLRNGNPPGDFTKALRCGARTRRGSRCKCPAMPNGRCRLHGGLSTGPRTAEGIERIRQAVTRHGRYSKTEKTRRRECRDLLRASHDLLSNLRDVVGRVKSDTITGGELSGSSRPRGRL